MIYFAHFEWSLTLSRWSKHLSCYKLSVRHLKTTEIRKAKSKMLWFRTRLPPVRMSRRGVCLHLLFSLIVRLQYRAASPICKHYPPLSRRGLPCFYPIRNTKWAPSRTVRSNKASLGLSATYSFVATCYRRGMIDHPKCKSRFRQNIKRTHIASLCTVKIPNNMFSYNVF